MRFQKRSCEAHCGEGFEVKASIEMILREFIRQYFCKHNWTLAQSYRHGIIRERDGVKDGEVTLFIFVCKKCGSDKIVPCDRTKESNLKILP